MQAKPNANRLMLVFFTYAAALTLVLWWTRGWIYIGVPHFDPALKPFLDAFVVLWTPEECVQGHGEWVADVCFFPSLAIEAHAQVYEPWFSFHRWGLGLEHHLLVSAAMIALFYAAIARTFRPHNAREIALSLIVLATPAVQLGVERANFDLLISALLCLAAWLLASDRGVKAVGACLVLGFATTLKIYPLLATAFAWAFAPRLRSVVIVAATLSALVAVAILGPENIAVLGQGAPEGATRFSTGAHWLFRHRSTSVGWLAATAAALTLALATAWLRKVPTPRFAKWPNRRTAFALAFIVAVPLFFLKDSYDYRFVLWLPCLALPLAWLRGGVHARWRVLAIATFSLFLLVAGIELPCSLLDTLGRRSDAGWITPVLATLVYVKQFSVWLLVAALSTIFSFSLVQQWAAGERRMH